MDEESKFIELTIPNKEVKYIFKNKILKWFKDKIKARDFSQMYDAIILGNKNVKQNSIK